jgi:collagen type III alpha
VAGRGRPNTPGDQYSEHTTDISGRSHGQPYVPSPALSPMHARPPLENGFPPPPDGTENPERLRMGGVFPGPPNRPTVTPPSGPDNTASWPTPAGAPAPSEDDQSRFDRYRPDAEPEAAAAPPPTPHVRMLPVLIGVIIGAALLVGLAIGVVWLIARGSDHGGFSVSAGDCVKKDGSEAVKATCGDPGSYQVVSIADTKDKCADPNQPYVLNPTKDGKTQVLCLKAAN